MARSKVRFEWNMDGFAELRSHPRLVGAMESGARAAAAGAPFDVEVATFPHRGRRSGPRTSAQIWANSAAARKAVNEQPGELLEVLGRVQI